MLLRGSHSQTMKSLLKCHLFASIVIASIFLARSRSAFMASFQDVFLAEVKSNGEMETERRRHDERLFNMGSTHFEYYSRALSRSTHDNEMPASFLRRRLSEEDKTDNHINVSIFDSEEFISLKADKVNEADRRKSKRFAITRTITGSISSISSLIFVIVIFRSHIGFGSPHHRLLAGLGVADFLSSLSQAIGPLMVPKELSYYVWGAAGNVASCTAQGFFVWFGIVGGILYNWTLCFYYLAVVRYEKSDQYISRKLEPFMHTAAIGVSLFASINLLVIKEYYPYGTGAVCGPNIFQAKKAPHCDGYEDGVIPPGGYTLPCNNSGSPGALKIPWMVSIVVTLSTPVVFVATLTMTYRAVRAIEKKTERYGSTAVRSLRKTCKSENPSTSTIAFTSGRRKIRSRSRTVFYKALCYVGAWTASYALIVFRMVIGLIGFEPSLRGQNIVADITIIFTPLQGFFNLIIFLQPRILSAKRNKKNNLSWFQAFVKALLSRGAEPGRRGSRINARSRNSNTSVETKYLSQTRHIRRVIDSSREEEKNEIATSVNFNLAPMIAGDVSKALSVANDDKSDEKIELCQKTSNDLGMGRNISDQQEEFDVKMVRLLENGNEDDLSEEIKG